MTWEETIISIRQKKEFDQLVADAYFAEDLELNVNRFKTSEEFKETKRLLLQYAPNAKTILDVGSGNGISSLAFALEGFAVTVSEPDSSDTVGAGAIRKLQKHFGLSNIEVHEKFAEDIKLDGKLFDIVYVRQAMHHAYDLNSFINNIGTLLKHGGIIMTVRDHVIYNAKDKEWFLASHPLHKYYGGENAFTLHEYQEAFRKAGLTIIKSLKYYDSVINYAPLNTEEVNNMISDKERELKQNLKRKIGVLATWPFLFNIYKKKINFYGLGFLNESNIPGRTYTFIAQK